MASILRRTDHMARVFRIFAVERGVKPKATKRRKRKRPDKTRKVLAAFSSADEAHKTCKTMSGKKGYLMLCFLYTCEDERMPNEWSVADEYALKEEQTAVYYKN